jgi:hypothetical protein
MLNLNPATRRSLTAESLDSKTNKPTAVECDMKGNAIGALAFPVPVYDDFAGKPWARLVAVMPSNTDPASTSLKEAYMEQAPVFVDGDSIMRGWYVPAPDFGLKPVAV